MVYPQSRSCNADLHAGMTDGTYKAYAINRGGVVEDTTVAVRRVMSGLWHGFSDLQSRILPDGTTATSLNYQDVTPQDKENV